MFINITICNIHNVNAVKEYSGYMQIYFKTLAQNAKLPP